MVYQTVFEFAGGASEPWWQGGVFGVPFVLVGIGLAAIVKRNGSLPGRGWEDRPKLSAAFVLAFLSFSVLWTALVFWSSWHRYSELQSAIATHRVHVAEGVVENFVPMPATGHALEHFCVSGNCFAYSDYVITQGFNKTSSHGGPIRAGLNVRVTFIGDTIVKLEVAS